MQHTLEKTQLRRLNNKGISIVELLGYTFLSGLVLSLLASLVLYVNRSNSYILETCYNTRSSVALYTNSLNEINKLGPDDAYTLNDGKTLVLLKQHTYSTVGNVITENTVPANDDTFLAKTVFDYDSTQQKIFVYKCTMKDSNTGLESEGNFRTYNKASYEIDTYKSKVSKALFAVPSIASRDVKNITFNITVSSNRKRTSDLNFVVPFYIYNSAN